MNYSELVDTYIKKSGLSLAEIAKRMEVEKGIKIDRSYISKLKNDPKYPATEEINRALAEITGGDPDALIMAAYLEKAPDSVKEVFAGVKNSNILLNEIFSFVTKFLAPNPEKFIKEQREQLLIENQNEEELIDQNLSQFEGSPEKMFTDWPFDLKIEFMEAFIKEAADKTKVPFNELLETMGYDLDEVKNDLINEKGLKTYNPFLRMPILGSIRAGEPIDRTENVVGYGLVDADLLCGGEGFSLRVKGDSMTGDRIQDGDIVVVLKQGEVDSNDIAVVAIGEDEATLRRVKLHGDMVMLSSSNPAYEPQLLPAKDVTIFGKVVEVTFSPK